MRRRRLWGKPYGSACALLVVGVLLLAGCGGSTAAGSSGNGVAETAAHPAAARMSSDEVCKLMSSRQIGRAIHLPIDAPHPIEFQPYAEPSTKTYEATCEWALRGQPRGVLYEPFGNDPVQLIVASEDKTALSYNCGGAGTPGRIVRSLQALVPKPGCLVSLPKGGFAVLAFGNGHLVTFGIALPQATAKEVVSLWHDADSRV